MYTLTHAGMCTKLIAISDVIDKINLRLHLLLSISLVLIDSIMYYEDNSESQHN